MDNKTTNNADSEQNQDKDLNLKGGQSAKADDKTTDSTNKGEELTLTDEQWEKVYQSPRFKQLNETAKKAKEKLEAIEVEKEKEAQKKLKEEGKYQELLEAKDKENEQLKSNLAGLMLNNQVLTIASKLKVLDTEAVVKLLDKNKLVTGEDGTYLNVEEVVKELLTEKPYLAGDSANTSSNIGSKANATTDSQNGNFVMTKTELQNKLKDHSWYLEHKDEITQWQKEGRIDFTK